MIYDSEDGDATLSKSKTCVRDLWIMVKSSTEVGVEEVLRLDFQSAVKGETHNMKMAGRCFFFFESLTSRERWWRILNIRRAASERGYRYRSARSAR